MEYNLQRQEFIEKFKSNNTTVNEPSAASIRFDGRWDYLHQLNKVKKVRIDKLREVRKREEYEKDMSECTFSPRTNKNYANISQGTCNKSTGRLPTLQELANLPLLDRQTSWNVRKSLKLDNIRNDQFMKEYQQCYFNPKIVRYVLI
jgi:hypothetical protein